MDVDAILARHPNTVVVDELAHTNVPGSKNRKRYEDVLELLDAGINVMTAVNIQHLETLNDAVNRSANTVIRETVPDSFLKRADEVVNVDVTVDELRTRLREEKSTLRKRWSSPSPTFSAKAISTCCASFRCAPPPNRSAIAPRSIAVSRASSRRQFQKR